MTKQLLESSIYAAIASITAVALIGVTFFMVEPAISHSQTLSNDFTIRQTITDENSFKVIANVLTDADSGTAGIQGINGVTGGNATGTTEVVVLSNNVAGYNVSIDFAYDLGGQTEAMVGDLDNGQEIRDYDGDVAGQPSYNFTASSAAMFAYTITSSSTDDVAQSFLSNGAVCNVPTVSSGVEEEDRCWKAPEDGLFQILNTDGPSPSGATSTLKFKVHVPASAVPVPTAQTYTATATLSLLSN
jgi:hypothetical protein